jgi:hypothetical protein
MVIKKIPFYFKEFYFLFMTPLWMEYEILFIFL